MNLKFLLIPALFVSANLSAAVSGWQEFELINGRILIDVEIAGVPAKALLDSGATGMSISTAFLTKQNIPYEKGRLYYTVGAHGRRQSHYIKEIDVTIFGKQFPLKNSRSLSANRSFQMLVGLPFFKLMIMQIDYPNSRIRFFSRDNVDLKGQANVDMRHGGEGSRLVVTIALEDGEKVDMMFDTGSTAGIVINRYIAEDKGWLEKFYAGDDRLHGVGGAITVEKLQLPYVKLGPYVLENVKVLVPKENNESTNYSQGKAAPRVGSRVNRDGGYDGILGGDIFKHFVITLDAKNALMHIDAPPRGASHGCTGPGQDTVNLSYPQVLYLKRRPPNRWTNWVKRQ